MIGPAAARFFERAFKQGAIFREDSRKIWDLFVIFRENNPNPNPNLNPKTNTYPKIFSPKIGRILGRYFS